MRYQADEWYSPTQSEAPGEIHHIKSNTRHTQTHRVTQRERRREMSRLGIKRNLLQDENKQATVESKLHKLCQKKMLGFSVMAEIHTPQMIKCISCQHLNSCWQQWFVTKCVVHGYIKCYYASFWSAGRTHTKKSISMDVIFICQCLPSNCVRSSDMCSSLHMIVLLVLCLHCVRYRADTW